MTIVRCANGMFPAYKDVGRMSAYGGGFNWSLQHIPRTCLLGFDIARSFGAFH